MIFSQCKKLGIVEMPLFGICLFYIYYRIIISSSSSLCICKL